MNDIEDVNEHNNTNKTTNESNVNDTNASNVAGNNTDLGRQDRQGRQGPQGNESKKWGYITLIGGSLLQFTIGAQLSWGNLVPYIASYLAATFIYHNNGNQSIALTDEYIASTYRLKTAEANWIYVIGTVLFVTGIYCGGSLEIRFGPRKTLLLASVCISSGFMLTYFALVIGGSAGLYLSMITLGLLWNFGNGLAYPILTIVCMRWFPNNRGLISGLCGAIFAMGIFLFVTLETQFINPNNALYNVNTGFVQRNDILLNIPFMFLYLSFIMITLQAVSLFCIRNPEWYSSMHPANGLSNADNNNMAAMVPLLGTVRDESAGGATSTSMAPIFDGSVDARQASSASASATVRPPMPIQVQTPAQSEMQLEYELYSLNLWQSLRFATFWVFLLATFCYIIMSSMFIMQWKVFAISYLQISNDVYLSSIGSFSALFNAFGRVFWGVVYDCSGNSFRVTFGAMSFVMTLFVATLPLCVYSKYVMFAVWSCMLWMNVNIVYAVLPSLISLSFGAKYVAAILAVFVVSEVLGSLIVAVFTSYINSLFAGWINYIFFIAAFGGLSTIVSVLAKPNIDRKAFFEKMSKQSDTKAEAMVDGRQTYDNYGSTSTAQ